MVVGGVCAIGGGGIGCVTTAIAALIIHIVGNSNFSAGSGRAIHDLENQNRGRKNKARSDGEQLRIWHDLGDGVIKDFFDVASLKAGVEHVLWDNEGKSAIWLLIK